MFLGVEKSSFMFVCLDYVEVERLLADTAVLLPGPLDPDPRRPHRTDHLLQALQRNPYHVLDCMACFDCALTKIKYSRVGTVISC